MSEGHFTDRALQRVEQPTALVNTQGIYTPDVINSGLSRSGIEPVAPGALPPFALDNQNNYPVKPESQAYAKAATDNQAGNTGSSGGVMDSLNSNSRVSQALAAMGLKFGPDAVMNLNFSMDRNGNPFTSAVVMDGAGNKRMVVSRGNGEISERVTDPNGNVLLLALSDGRIQTFK